MQELIFFIHILAAILIIALVFVQHGKGADMGAGFGGGSSQTLFGSVGSVPFFAKLTAVVALIFFITNLLLGKVIYKKVKQNEGVLLSQKFVLEPGQHNKKVNK